MKKAFDQNVSRAKPRLRLGGVPPEAEPAPEPASSALVEPEGSAAPAALEVPAAPVAQAALDLEVKARVQRARKPQLTATEALSRALDPAPPPAPAPVRAWVEAPAPAVEVQQPAKRPTRESVRESAEEDQKARRERLKARLKAVRENPRPEPLPPSVAQAGVLAVERISTLQAELTQARAVNLALTQDLEAARRQAERATEEARLRMDEANRLAGEVEGRLGLLKELERELAAIESERDEALLALQDARAVISASGEERVRLEAELGRRDEALSESLVEEERLATELEEAKDEARALRRTLEALTTERDTLARQVADLTKERSELLDARKALEAVHRALSQAVAR